jgi:hypothetical protein
MRDSNLKPKGYLKVTVSNTAVGLTIPDGARFAMFKLNDSNTLRWRDDNVNPTSTEGMLLEQGDDFWYTGVLRYWKAIRTGSSDATLLVMFYA